MSTIRTCNPFLTWTFGKRWAYSPRLDNQGPSCPTLCLGIPRVGIPRVEISFEFEFPCSATIGPLALLWLGLQQAFNGFACLDVCIETDSGPRQPSLRDPGPWAVSGTHFGGLGGREGDPHWRPTAARVPPTPQAFHFHFRSGLPCPGSVTLQAASYRLGLPSMGFLHGPSPKPPGLPPPLGLPCPGSVTLLAASSPLGLPSLGFCTGLLRLGLVTMWEARPPPPSSLTLDLCCPHPSIHLVFFDDLFGPFSSNEATPLEGPRTSARLSNRTSESVLGRAISRKARLLEGGSIRFGSAQQNWTDHKVKSKAALCGVTIFDAEAARLRIFLQADA
uniref:Uncharacterized protein n=1 Tax=Ananas comosus var. bracteatus TaxID=296719 RepID=A0A6V7QC65_ANACO|nr:unnamed protein product [Ananas comosus var. bracteatus]